VLAAAAGVWLYQIVPQPYKGYGGEEQFVDIPPGVSSVAIGACSRRSP